MKKYKFIFWDMDGTLANTYEGVTNCVKYAMEPVSYTHLTLPTKA